ncbi:DUF1624 domain-containing protein [Pelagibacterium sp.]|uniref:DUF1624 domain-containing protein n=1 Tax=Pelagibacterium sp. TaxID=1967288 RepID=UPI003BAA8E48
MTSIAPASRPRIAAIDIARGVAIVAMVIYHFAWDLAFLGFVDFDPTQSLPWVIFQKSIVGTFIFLTGVSLALGHGQTIRWRPFWRRFAIILGAALLITVGTYAFNPSTFVYFGVLHAIALFSLMGLAFLSAPLVLILALAVILIGLQLFIQSPLFGEKLWSWIGLWDAPPPTEDLVPVFPWFGVALLGIAATRWAINTRVRSGKVADVSGSVARPENDMDPSEASSLTDRLAQFKGTSAPSRAMSKVGRWSLVIYVLHQPILIGTLMGIASLTGISETRRAENFLSSCQASCTQSAPDAAYCTAYCACTLNSIEADNLWPLLESPQRTPDQDIALSDLTNQCAAQVLDEMLLVPKAE